jgi:DNA-binding NarL/FixJ family response regulator
MVDCSVSRRQPRAEALATLRAAADVYRKHEAGEAWLQRISSPEANVAGGKHLAMRGQSKSGPQLPDDLSAREIGVLRLVATGHTTREIAEQLVISPRGRPTYREHLQQDRRTRPRRCCGLRGTPPARCLSQTTSSS